MAEKIPMLALSPTMEQGVIVKWLKEEGDPVSQGQVLCEVETDKATMEYESPADGTLLKIILNTEQSASIGQPIAIIGEEGEDISDLVAEAEKEAAQEQNDQDKKEKQSEKSEKTEPSESQPQKTRKQTQNESQPAEKNQKTSGKTKSSPLARKIAAEKGIDINQIKGTGPDGRITAQDVNAAEGEKPQPAPAPSPKDQHPAGIAKTPGLTDEKKPISQKRKIIAQRLSQSKYSAPHYYLKTTVIADSLLAARKKLNARTSTKVSLNAFIIKFVAQTLAAHPTVNSTWTDEAILAHSTADIALAVAQPEGLITPVVRDCTSKGILAIDAELKALIEKARAGTIAPEEYSESTFTITNLGSYGIEEFTAIINPPNSAILAVGKALKTPVVDDSNNINIHNTIKLTLSCDHRLIDGAVGAKFLYDLKDIIEYPASLLY
jgi:pyruvate dehydrogenase E2 component (dihydrolipoamide acetyltransferase)